MGSRILVIDDEAVVLGAVRKALGRMDYTVDTMDTAREALKLLDNTTYDLVITDLMMPDMDGLEFMRHLHDRKATTQVIMLTGYPTIQSALQAKRLGAFEYVTKPFTRQELLSVVVRALRLGSLKAGEQESSLQAPGNLYLLPEHSWARVEHEGTVQIGMARAFAVGVARVAGLELPVLNANVEQGRVCVIVRAEDAVEHQLHSPLSGRVVEVNPAVLESPELAAEDPESAGWLLRLIPTDLDKELHNLVPR
jgi:CheY-like chemotaxis protein/glycine cleavage system H lipoate-binding protein